MNADLVKHELQFKKTSRTSRGEIKTHAAWIIRLQQGASVGYGEAAPLKGLSVDDIPDFENRLRAVLVQIQEGIHPFDTDLEDLPSVRFALETAYAALTHQSPFLVEKNGFIHGRGIPINGLVWMNDVNTMYEDAKLRMQEGFTCLKFKVGALEFDEECKLLERVRKSFTGIIRLDANGALKPDEALEKLKEFSRFTIHSIEQPIAVKQEDFLAEVCAQSKIPIAIDEELIGLNPWKDGQALLKKVNPAYLIIKPTLIGGFKAADEWIKLANQHHIGWWATSALESNIGLNAIAQWCMKYDPKIPQGLGTGTLYTNNIASPLKQSAGVLTYQSALEWELPL